MNSKKPPTRKLIVIAGTHRSGTSTLAGCLHSAGIEFGSPLLPPGPDNPKGYFEHQDVVSMHDDFLSRLGTHWSDPVPFYSDPTTNDEMVDQIKSTLIKIMGKSRTFAIKDPRIPIFLPLWEQACKELGIENRWIIPYRNPHAVIQSLTKRDGLKQRHAEALWYRDLRSIAAFSAKRPHVIIHYENLITDPRAALEPLVIEKLITEKEIARSISFIEPNLDHHRKNETVRLESNYSNDLNEKFNQTTLKWTTIDDSAMPTCIPDFIDSIDESSWPQMLCQLYYRKSSDPFNEENSSSVRYSAGVNTQIELCIPPHNCNSFRLDPIDKSGICLLSNAAIDFTDGSSIALDETNFNLGSTGGIRWTQHGIIIFSAIDDCNINISIGTTENVASKFRGRLTALPNTEKIQIKLDDDGLHIPGKIENLIQLLTPTRLKIASNHLNKLLLDNKSLQTQLDESATVNRTNELLERQTSFMSQEQTLLRNDLMEAVEKAINHGCDLFTKTTSALAKNTTETVIHELKKEVNNNYVEIIKEIEDSSRVTRNEISLSCSKITILQDNITEIPALLTNNIEKFIDEFKGETQDNYNLFIKSIVDSSRSVQLELAQLRNNSTVFQDNIKANFNNVEAIIFAAKNELQNSHAKVDREIGNAAQTVQLGIVQLHQEISSTHNLTRNEISIIKSHLPAIDRAVELIILLQSITEGIKIQTEKNALDFDERLKALFAWTHEAEEKIDLLIKKSNTSSNELRTMKEEDSIRSMNTQVQLSSLDMKLQITNEKMTTLESSSKEILGILNRSPWIVRVFQKSTRRVIKAASILIRKKSNP